MHRLLIWAAIVLVPSAVLGQSTCPDGQALATTGIAFVDDYGVAELHRETAPNIVTVTVVDGSYQVRNTLAHGVHVLQLADVENGQLVPDTIWDFSYSVANEKLPRPTPNGSWSTNSTYTFAGDRDTEQVRHTWGGITQYSFGACTLDAIPVRIEYTSQTYDHVEELMYFPSLGTAILTVYEDADARDEYTFVDIRIP